MSDIFSIWISIFLLSRIRMVKLIYVLSVAFGFSLASIGQPISEPISMQKRDESNGLLYNRIDCIFKDRTGFIWLGTELGLSRFDSRKFRSFAYDKEGKKGLPHCHVVDITQLQDGRMAIGLEQGFTFFEPLSETFQSFSPLEGAENGFSAAYYAKIFQAKNGGIWIYTLDGLYAYHAEKLTFTRFFNPTTLHSGNSQKPANRIYDMVEDEHGIFWIGTGDGLFRFNPATGQWKRAFSPIVTENYLRFGDLVGDLEWLDSETLLITRFDQGLFSYHIPSGNLKILHSLQPATSVKTVSWMSEKLILIQSGNGLLAGNVSGKSYQRLTTIPQVRSLMVDSGNNIWLGTESDGFLWFHERNQMHTIFGADNKVKPTGWFTAFLEERDRIWLGAYYGNDVSVWDKKKGQLCRKWTRLPEKPGNEPHVNVGHILKTGEWVYWFSTLFGLFQYDEIKDTWQHWKAEGNSKGETFSNSRLVKAQMDGDSAIWLLGYDHRIRKFRKKTGTIVTPDSIQLTSWGLPKMYLEDIVNIDGKLWVCGAGGIFRQQSGSAQFAPFINSPAQHFFQFSNGPDGSLWCSGADTLFQWNRLGQLIYKIPIAKIFSVPGLNGFFVDRLGLVWAHHLRGISVYSLENKQVRHFSSADGLPREPVHGMSSGDTEKRWYFANNQLGYLRFSPELLELPKPTVSITRILGKGIPLQIKAKPEPLELPYDNNDLEIEFSVLDFAQPSNIRYYYSIENQENNWHEVAEGRISFSNLAPGRYAIRMANQPSADPGEAKMVLIVIHPPFWETWWFRMLILLLLAGGIFFLFRWRVGKIAEGARIERELAELRMQTLRSQMNPHFLFNCFNAIQECVLDGRTREAATYLARFARLVRLILEYSDYAEISLSQEVNMLTQYLEMEKLRFSSEIQFDLQMENLPDPQLLQLPPMLLQPFVENALWHGLQKKEGNKKLSIRFWMETQDLVAEIEDNGIGRSQSARQRTAQHRSKAMEIFEERRKLLSHSGLAIRLAIDDLEDQTGKAAGTKIRIYIPQP